MHSITGFLDIKSYSFSTRVEDIVEKGRGVFAIAAAGQAFRIMPREKAENC
jgi:hypothetical protein